ncbi:sensor histidine kinase [Cohnella nanjingensis]|uniref:histidine kinase n=1 Tax=Cohnella nanjingensis TaxID=1387779 RepID=A0A7X0VI65_9BACL|nr:sensor histidine kinase [Cohnella nanjingensis]MBB6674875.1 sensor histidine kinase [Cohnella nanjingensis]
MKIKMTNPLTRMRVKQQLILLFFVLVSPVFLLNWYANTKAEDILKRNVTNAYAELNKQNFSLIGRDIDTISRIMTTIIQNPVTQSLQHLDEPMDDPTDPDETFDRVKQYQAADRLLNNYSLGMTGGEAVYYYLYVYDPEGQYPFAPIPQSKYKNGGVFFYSDDNKPDWIDEALELKGKGYLKLVKELSSASSQNTLGYFRAVNSTMQGNVAIGVLVATNMNKKIEQSLQPVSLPDDGEIYLTDYGNRIQAASNGKIGSTLDLPANLVTGDDPEGTVDVIDSNYIYVEHYHYASQQKLIYRIPTRSMLQQSSELKQVIQLITIVYLLFGIVVMAYFWRSLLTPMQRLAVFTRSYVPGKKVPDRIENERNDEVGVLIHSVHGMARRMNTLIEDRYMMEIKQKEIELQVLYQQINPHLLYNTLESIYWKSALEGNSQSAEMIKELAKLMRIALSRGRELIPLDEELEHAVAYMNLQQKRYEYEFKVTWTMAEDTLRNLIPKITLQPLIENAIIHGVRNMGEDGEIAISSCREEDRIVIRIADNGYKAADYEAIARILAADQEQPSTGYGIRNVHQRIGLHFGPDYGLHYAAREGGGTVVTITLPIREYKEQEGD